MGDINLTVTMWVYNRYTGEQVPVPDRGGHHYNHNYPQGKLPLYYICNVTP